MDDKTPEVNEPYQTPENKKPLVSREKQGLAELL